MIEPLAAATVMVTRESAAGIELFMLRRSSKSSFMPDVFVFPGGRVEPQDADSRARGRITGGAGNLDAAYVYAAARETFEECGLLFATARIDPDELALARERLLAGAYTFTQMLIDFDTSVDAGALRYFSRWITPPLETRRFDTHFFVARAPADQAARADAFETHDGLWITPADALTRYTAGTFALIFPTIKHLERLRSFSSTDALLEYASKKAIRTVMPDAAAGSAFTIPQTLEDQW